jgi:radical SAM protein with 4Fe4S-binding SPASM domain
MSWLAQHRPGDHRPYHVQVEVTWRCSWRCVHCYQDDHEVEALTRDDLTRLFDELVACGTLHVIITGGEPLVRRDMLDILRDARSRGLAITLYTNAHAITESVARELSRLIAVAEVSILAGTDEVHDALTRVRGSSRRAWAGIDAMTAAGIAVVVKTPLLAPAFKTLRELADRVAQRRLEWNPDPDLSQSYAGDTYPLAYRLAPEDVEGFYRDFPRFNPTAVRLRNDPGAPRGMCLAGRQYAFIDARGNVYPCLSFKSAADRSPGHPHSPHLGNVRRQSFGTIWAHSAALAEIRAATRESFGRCATCTGTCQPCMAASFEQSGDMFASATPVCELTARATAARRLPIVH